MMSVTSSSHTFTCCSLPMAGSGVVRWNHGRALLVMCDDMPAAATRTHRVAVLLMIFDRLRFVVRVLAAGLSNRPRDGSTYSVTCIQSGIHGVRCDSMADLRRSHRWRSFTLSGGSLFSLARASVIVISCLLAL